MNNDHPQSDHAGLAHLPGVDIAYRTAGNVNAPAVVLSNSIGTTASLWDPIVPTLAKDFYVIRYDSRGHGGSSTPHGPYTLSDLAGDIAGLLDHLAIDSAHLVGLSIGGMTALTFAVEYPGRINRLVVSNTGAKIGTPDSWEQRATTVREVGMTGISDKVLAGWLTPGYAADHPDHVDTMRGWLLANDPQGYANTCSALAHGDLREQLADISAPTLVLGGSDDVPTPPELTRRIADGIGGASFLHVPGAHLAVQEAPEPYARAVIEFLRS